jgi:hypothetical protein
VRLCRKGEEAEEIFQFLSFWKDSHGNYPREVVFDSRLTTYPNLVRLDEILGLFRLAGEQRFTLPNPGLYLIGANACDSNYSIMDEGDGAGQNRLAIHLDIFAHSRQGGQTLHA